MQGEHDKFELVFKTLLEVLFVERRDRNEEISARFMNDKSFQKVDDWWLSSDAFQKLRLTPSSEPDRAELEVLSDPAN